MSKYDFNTSSGICRHVIYSETWDYPCTGKGWCYNMCFPEICACFLTHLQFVAREWCLVEESSCFAFFNLCVDHLEVRYFQCIYCGSDSLHGIWLYMWIPHRRFPCAWFLTWRVSLLDSLLFIVMMMENLWQRDMQMDSLLLMKGILFFIPLGTPIEGCFHVPFLGCIFARWKSNLIPLLNCVTFFMFKHWCVVFCSLSLHWH